MQNLLVVAAALTLTACPGPDGGGGNNDPAQLIGTWSNQSPDPSDDSQSVTFHPDGTYEINDDLETGTYVADARTLTMTAESGSVDVMPYAVEGDRMLGIGMRRDPATAGEGLVGEWRADGIANDEPQFMDLTIRADSTMVLEMPGDPEVTRLEGTWAVEGDVLVTTFAFGEDPSAVFELEWFSVGGALGTPLYTRD